MSKVRKDSSSLGKLTIYFILALLAEGLGIALFFYLPLELAKIPILIIMVAGIFIFQFLLAFLELLLVKISPYIVRDYFDTEKFLQIKAETRQSTEEYNAMCDYVNRIEKEYYARGYVLCSRDQLEKLSELDEKEIESSNMDRVCQCSKEEYKKALEAPFEYLSQLFDIEINDKTLGELIAMNNALFIASECGLEHLRKRIRVAKEVLKKVPLRIRFFAASELYKNIGLNDYRTPNVQLFNFVVKCKSTPGSEQFSLKFDNETLQNFILYAQKKLREQGEYFKPRLLVTAKLKRSIIQRDNNCCCLCGASADKDDTLFLELEYVENADGNVPISDERIRVVCWKCKWDVRSLSDLQSTIDN